MTRTDDPFIILGVSAEASREEVQRAYRRLAMFWHPDRNPSPIAGNEFKRIHAAYELLRDPQRLAESRQAQTSGATASDTAADSGGADLVLAMILTLEEAASGCRKNVELIDSVRCRTCAGSGRVQHDHLVPCPACSGCGRVSRASGRTSRCDICAGRGYLRETACTDCLGSGRQQALRTLAVTVPPGLLDGERLRLTRQAPRPPGGEEAVAGDLYLEIRFAAHALFVVQGRDLHCRVPVSVFRRLAGGRVEVPTLTGSVSFALPPWAQHTGEHRLPGYGYPGKRAGAAGDLVVHLQSIDPHVGPDDIELLEGLEGLEGRLAAALERRAPQLAAWELQMRARRQEASG